MINIEIVKQYWRIPRKFPALDTSRRLRNQIHRTRCRCQTPLIYLSHLYLYAFLGFFFFVSSMNRVLSFCRCNGFREGDWGVAVPVERWVSRGRAGLGPGLYPSTRRSYCKMQHKRCRKDSEERLEVTINIFPGLVCQSVWVGLHSDRKACDSGISAPTLEFF